MGNVADKKFTWVITNFSSLHSEKIYSGEFVISGCKWRLRAYPKGLFKDKCLSLFLSIADYENFPCGWRRRAKYRLSVVNQLDDNLSKVQESQPMWFDHKVPARGFGDLLPHAKLYAKDCGFMVNNEVKVVAEVEVLEVIGSLDVLEESEEVAVTQQHLKKVKREDGVESSDLLDKIQETKGSVDVNGFQVLPSQVDFVRRIFEKHPDMALEFRAKSQHLRTACMSVLLNLIETLCQSLQELSYDDLVGAESALTYAKASGFKVGWLEQKLEEVKEKKKEEEIGETRAQELEEELNNFTQKCSDIKALLEMEKAKVLAARASPLTVNDIL